MAARDGSEHRSYRSRPQSNSAQIRELGTRNAPGAYLAYFHSHQIFSVVHLTSAGIDVVAVAPTNAALLARSFAARVAPRLQRVLYQGPYGEQGELDFIRELRLHVDVIEPHLFPNTAARGIFA